MQKYSALFYGQLSRDMLEISIKDDKYSYIVMGLYAYLLLNANPKTGEVRTENTIKDIENCFKIKERRAYYAFEKLKESNAYIREAKTTTISGNLPHFHKIQQDRNHYRHLGTDPGALAADAHPIANLFVGHLPHLFLEKCIDNQKDYKRPEHLLFWWLSLNIDKDTYHLSRIPDIPDLADILGISKHRIPRAYAQFQKDGLFDIKKPSHIQGTVTAIETAEAAAAAAKRERDYQRAENDYIKSERERMKAERERSLHDEEVKALRRTFRDYFEETGEYLENTSPIYRAKDRKNP